MAVITKAHALHVIHRALGPSHAEAVADRLPDRINLDDDADRKLLFELGLTPDRLFSDLGAEL
jgi:hypothetical protein